MGPDVATLLQEPLDSRKTAEAYEKACQASVSNSDKIRRSLRDLLVLQVCIGAGVRNQSSLKHVMEEVFGKELDDILDSQLALAFSKILHLSKNRTEFNKFIEMTYGRGLDAAQAEDLFEAYRRLAYEGQAYTSKAKTRHGRRSRAARPAAFPGLEEDLIDIGVFSS